MKTYLVHALLLGAIATTMSAADAFAGAIEQGKVTLNARARYEDVSQTGLRDASALTLRARLGFSTAPLHGFTALVEFEHISALDGDSYSQAGLNPGGAGRAVIPDPEGTELNQAFLRYARGQTTYTVGRQQLVLDNARFIGDVGWRQNQQTFDAVSVRDKTLADTTLTYAYLSQINRIFGDDHPAGRWDSDSHLFNANYTGLTFGTLTGYAYLLDFDNAATNSNATYGLSLSGQKPLNDDLKFTYRAEFADQSDYGSSPLNYRTEYYALSGGLSSALGSITLAHEILGSDRGIGFKTPLATLHAFNGWADQFLSTPGDGLRDTSAAITSNLPAKTVLTAIYHHYETDRANRNLGHEWDLQLAHPFSPQIKGLIKYADFTSDISTLPHVRKFWLQIEYAL